jgi:hypothetical protein
MPFEVFSKQAFAAAGEPTVSIQRRGIISMNHAAFVALGEPEAVELLYDRAKHLVGLRAVEPDAETANPVRSDGSSSGHVVTAMKFTKHYGIPTDVGHRWVAKLDGDILLVEISKRPKA